MLVVNCADLVFVRLPVGTTVWDRALQRLSDAVEGIESRISVSAACQKDLDALSAAGGPGLSLAGIQDKLATVDLQNGPRSNAPLAVLSRDPMNLAETQHKRCSFFAPFLPKRDQSGVKALLYVLGRRASHRAEAGSPVARSYMALWWFRNSCGTRFTISSRRTICLAS